MSFYRISRVGPVRIGIIRADKRGMVRNNHLEITQKSINFYMFSMFFHNESIVNMRLGTQLVLTL